MSVLCVLKGFILFCLESACNLSHMLCMCDNVKQQRRIITQSPEAIFLKTLSCCHLLYLSLSETSCRQCRFFVYCSHERFYMFCLESACNLSHMLCMCDNVKQQRRIITQSPEAIFLKTLSCCHLVYLSLYCFYKQSRFFVY